MADKSSPSSSSIDVVMVPFPLQSHLNLLFQLSHAIASKNIRVHYAASLLHVSQVKSRVASRDLNPNITFHGFPTPDFPSPPPTNTLSHLLPSFEASNSLRSHVTSLLESLSGTTRRLVVIFDTLVSIVVQDAHALPNAEFYVFSCVSAVSSFAFASEKAGLKKGEVIPSPEDCIDAVLLQFFFRQREGRKMLKISGQLRNTSRFIESEFLDFVEKKEREADESIKHWAIGPLKTVTEFKNRRTGTSHPSKRVGQCFEWLNNQEPTSVLYVCFGTTTSMEDEQIGELAIGLEKSGAKFIWVLRDADKANIFDEVEVRKPQLPLEFEERVEGSGMGMVVREWAPQLEILGHPSTGGFMSHCGWNSCMEAMSLGVPLATWPNAGDQPMNAALITSVLNTGIVVREWAKRKELVSSSTISEAVRLLMKSKEGEEIRERAENLGSKMGTSTGKGGVASSEFDSFLSHITRI